MKTQAAPELGLLYESSWGPPRIAVSPSEESPTDEPCAAPPSAPIPTSSAPCCAHTPPLLVNTHAAPAPTLSSLPTIAVLPSEERATELPCLMFPAAPVPTSL